MSTIITDDGLETLFSEEYNQTYHSRRGVLQEAEHVFLKASGAQARMQNAKPLHILEVGFGTGFNFLLTLKHALEYNAPLHYTALEKNLLSLQQFSMLNYGFMETERHIFLNWYKQNPHIKQGGIFTLTINEHISLTLVVGEATVQSLLQNHFNVVYHDAFSPDANPELWTLSFFSKVQNAMCSGGKLSTYSAKGSVRRTLISAGFIVHKLPGPKGKREMLVAQKV